MDNILVNLPGFWQEYKLTLALIDLQQKYPSLYKDNIKLNTVYDCFPCIWTGGRSAPHDYIVTRQEIEDKIIPFLEKGIGIRYNFTNLLLEQKHLLDKNSNNIVDITFDILKNYSLPLGITISSPLLKQYLETKYPKLYFIWSTTLGKIGIDKINELSKKDLFVLDYNYNNNFDFLNQLQYPQNIEILINEYCVPECPYRDKHWALVSEAQLAEKPNIQTGCLNKVMKTEYGTKPNGKIVTIEEMKNKYLPIGINKIKLAGRREYEKGLAGQYAQILFKEEYQKDIYEYLYQNYITWK